nr:transposase [Pseudomonadota bacterium]
RVYGIALGYEDLNDHDTLRHDVLLGVLGEKEEPEFLAKGENPRFIVTSLSKDEQEAQPSSAPEV